MCKDNPILGLTQIFVPKKRKKSRSADRDNECKKQPMR